MNGEFVGVVPVAIGLALGWVLGGLLFFAGEWAYNEARWHLWRWRNAQEEKRAAQRHNDERGVDAQWPL